jgi:hypothetical protein
MARKRGGAAHLSATERERLKAAILAAPAATLKALAVAHGVSPATIHYWRLRLGVLPPRVLRRRR